MIDYHKHRDNNTLQIQSKLTTMSFYAGSSFPPSNSGRVTIVEAGDDLPQRVAFLDWRSRPRQKPRPLASTLTHKWISFCTYLSKTMKLRNGCKRNCCSAEIALNVSEEEVFVQYTSNRSGYLCHLFISEEESLWRNNCEQSFDICFNKSSLSSSLHLSLVPFHLLIWRD